MRHCSFESGRAEDFRPLIVVTASPVTQIERIMSRDGLDRASARARLDAQMPVADKAAIADHIVSNDSSLNALRIQVDALWRTLVEH